MKPAGLVHEKEHLTARKAARVFGFAFVGVGNTQNPRRSGLLLQASRHQREGFDSGHAQKEAKEMPNTNTSVVAVKDVGVAAQVSWVEVPLRKPVRNRQFLLLSKYETQ